MEVAAIIATNGAEYPTGVLASGSIAGTLNHFHGVAFTGSDSTTAGSTLHSTRQEVGTASCRSISCALFISKSFSISKYSLQEDFEHVRKTWVARVVQEDSDSNA